MLCGCSSTFIFFFEASSSSLSLALRTAGFLLDIFSDFLKQYKNNMEKDKYNCFFDKNY